MSEPIQTSPKVSRERLNQIAARKLTALGVPWQLVAADDTVRGQLALASGKVLHPASGTPIGSVQFLVVGHDHLQLLDAPLRALAPVPFYDVSRLVELEERIAIALRVRMQSLRDLAGRLQAFSLPVSLETNRLEVLSQVRTTEYVFDLVGAPEGIRVVRVAPLHGKPFEVAAELSPLFRISDFKAAIDLELELGERVKQMRPAEGRPAPGAQARLVTVAPAAGALRLGQLAERFGPEACVTPGKPLEITQELDFGGRRYHFIAVHEGGSVFRGRLHGPEGDPWGDRFDLERFPGVEPLVALVLGISTTTPTSPAPEPKSTPAGALAPQPGEVWVMNVVVEREDAGEVRYACVDVNGQPYGAARVLPRKDFETVFTQHRGSWRLLILIDQVDGESVTYRQLDSARTPRGTSKTLSIRTLTANFFPEATEY